jgi:hypothetical protein
LALDDPRRWFDRFLLRYNADGANRAAAWSDEQTEELLGCRPALFTEWQMVNGSASYAKGLIRFVMPDGTAGALSLRQWNGANGWAFSWPLYRNRLIVFAYDWLGRQIALDIARKHQGEPLVSIFEPGTGELLEVPATFSGFMQKTVIDQADAALADEFHRNWRQSGGRAPAVTQCVGYKRPLFVGGEDVVANLELSDMDVYITVCGQLYARYVGGAAN